MPNLVYRVCHAFQIDACQNRDETPIKSGSETFGMAQLRGRACLAFTDRKDLLKHFASRIEVGGGVLELDLDAVADCDKGFWPKTGDHHIAATAVFAHARQLTPAEVAMLFGKPPADNDLWLDDIKAATKGLPTDRWTVSSGIKKGPEGEKLVGLTFTDPLRDGPDAHFDVDLPEDASHEQVRKAIRTAFQKYFRSHPVTRGA